MEAKATAIKQELKMQEWSAQIKVQFRPMV